MDSTVACKKVGKYTERRRTGYICAGDEVTEESMAAEPENIEVRRPEYWTAHREEVRKRKQGTYSR